MSRLNGRSALLSAWPVPNDGRRPAPGPRPGGLRILVGPLQARGGGPDATGTVTVGRPLLRLIRVQGFGGAAHPPQQPRGPGGEARGRWVIPSPRGKTRRRADWAALGRHRTRTGPGRPGVPLRVPARERRPTWAGPSAGQQLKRPGPGTTATHRTQ